MDLMNNTFSRHRLLRKAYCLDKAGYERTQFLGPYGKARRNATRYSCLTSKWRRES